MGLPERLQKWLGRGASREPDAEQLAREEAFKARLRERCTRFRRLLSSNKAALEAMKGRGRAVALVGAAWHPAEGHLPCAWPLCLAFCPRCSCAAPRLRQE